MTKNHKNILLIGVFNKSFSTSIEMAQALRDLGHNVQTFDYRELQDINSGFADKLLRYLKRKSPILSQKAKNIFYSRNNRHFVHNQLRNIFSDQIDLAIFLKVDTLDPKILNSNNFSSVYYFMDPPDVAKSIHIEEYLRNCDISFATFSSICNQYSNKYRILNVSQGYDPAKFMPYKKFHNRKLAVVFAGSKNKSRYSIAKKVNKTLDIDCYGHGWHREPIYNSMLNDLYNSYKFALNITRDSDGFSVRVPQIMATGACLITDLSQDIINTFPPETYLSLNKFYSLSPEDFLDDSIFESISNNAIAFVSNEFSWRSKMSQLLNLTDLHLDLK